MVKRIFESILNSLKLMDITVLEKISLKNRSKLLIKLETTVAIATSSAAI